MKRFLVFFLWTSITYLGFAQGNDPNPEITAKEIKAHITYLASDALQGRFTGSEGAREAGSYIENQFKTYGLKPLFDGSYFQNFDFVERVELTDNNSLAIEMNGKKIEPELKTDYITAPFSGNTSLSGGLVFVGYGISATDFDYDDYNGIDVNGKFVLAMRYTPDHDSVESKLERFASFRQKASAAKDKGALGIIFVNGYAPQNDDDDLMALHYDGAPGMDDFAVLQIKRSLADKLFESQSMNFNEIQKKIDKSKKPESFEFMNVNIDAKTGIKEIESVGRNVAGYLEGNDPELKDQYIVIGGHFDHLGINQLKSSSMYRGSEPMIHNGADDNASGTTGVLELAEKFASMKDQIKRSIIFITFSGEELGLLGSSHFVNNSPVPLDQIIAMLNMDMVGRLSDNKLTVIGTGTSSIWEDLLNEKNSYGLDLSFSEAGTGGSDHQSFTNKNIPVLFFFTGTHSDYHKPSDDADKINNEGEEKVVNFVYDIADAVDLEETKPDYVKVEAEPQRKSVRSKVTVGTVPEFGYQGKGYKISGVSEGGPAQKAGMQAGDIMLKFGDKDIGNIYDFMYAMGKYSPGDSVDVVVKRGDEEITLHLLLEAK